jgi:hypothetical protein
MSKNNIDSDGWQVVNTKEKKKQKEIKRLEKRESEKAQKQKEKELEERQLKLEQERFYSKYVAAKGTNKHDDNMFSAGFLALKEQELNQKVTRLEPFLLNRDFFS